MPVYRWASQDIWVDGFIFIDPLVGAVGVGAIHDPLAGVSQGVDIETGSGTFTGTTGGGEHILVGDKFPLSSQQGVGSFGLLVGSFPLTYSTELIGWRYTLIILSFINFFISIIIFLCLDKSLPNDNKVNRFSDLFKIFKVKKIWFILIYILIVKFLNNVLVNLCIII